MNVDDITKTVKNNLMQPIQIPISTPQVSPADENPSSEPISGQ